LKSQIPFYLKCVKLRQFELLRILPLGEVVLPRTAVLRCGDRWGYYPNSPQRQTPNYPDKSGATASPKGRIFSLLKFVKGLTTRPVGLRGGWYRKTCNFINSLTWMIRILDFITIKFINC